MIQNQRTTRSHSKFNFIQFWTNLIQIKNLNTWSDSAYLRNLYIQFFFWNQTNFIFLITFLLNLKLCPNQKYKLRFSISKYSRIHFFVTLNSWGKNRHNILISTHTTSSCIYNIQAWYRSDFGLKLNIWYIIGFWLNINVVLFRWHNELFLLELN